MRRPRSSCEANLLTQDGHGNIQNYEVRAACRVQRHLTITNSANELKF
jgi:hypothetical protein